MNKNNIVLGIIGVVAIVGALLFGSQISNLTGEVGKIAGNIKTNQGQILGGISGTDSVGCYSVNGVVRCATRRGITIATTTPWCSIKSPAATSTLVAGSFQFNVGGAPTTTGIVHIAQAATSQATTTLLNFAFLHAANAPDTIIASTTLQNNAGAITFAPNTFFNVGFQATTSYIATSTGSCQATFEVL